MITERELRVFFEVCKHMNMSKASKELYISQPAVSKIIRDIEEEYNITLFERRNKKLYLTAQGSRLIEDARQIIGLLDSVDRNLQSEAEKETIRVGASITIGTSALCWIVGEYLKSHNNIRIESIVDNTDVIEKKLLEGKLDIAFVEGRVSDPNIRTDDVSEIDIVLVVNKDHPLYHAESVSVKDLEDMDFIVRESGSRTRENFTAAMYKSGVRWHPTWECHNTQTIKNAVDAGLGIGVLSRLSVRHRIESGRVKALNVFEEPLRIYVRLAYRSDKFFSDSLTEFKNFAVKRIAEYN